MSKALLKEMVVPGTGVFSVKSIDLGSARAWAKDNEFNSSVGTVLSGVLGVEQEQVAANDQYEEALVIRPVFDVNPDRFYTSDEMQEGGVECFLIKKVW